MEPNQTENWNNVPKDWTGTVLQAAGTVLVILSAIFCFLGASYANGYWRFFGIVPASLDFQYLDYLFYAYNASQINLGDVAVLLISLVMGTWLIFLLFLKFDQFFKATFVPLKPFDPHSLQGKTKRSMAKLLDWVFRNFFNHSFKFFHLILVFWGLAFEMFFVFFIFRQFYEAGWNSGQFVARNSMSYYEKQKGVSFVIKPDYLKQLPKDFIKANGKGDVKLLAQSKQSYYLIILPKEGGVWPPSKAYELPKEEVVWAEFALDHSG